MMNSPNSEGKTINDLLKIVGRLGELLMLHVVCIMQDDEQGYSKAIGTGILVKHLGQPYLISAGHVFEHATDGDLYFYSENNIIRFIAGTILRFPRIARKESLNDTIDVGIIRLVSPTAHSN